MEGSGAGRVASGKTGALGRSERFRPGLEGQADSRCGAEQVRWLAENLVEVVWASDLAMRLTYVSPSVKRQLGYMPAEVIGKPVASLMTPAAVERAGAALLGRLMSGANERGEQAAIDLAMLHKDGSIVPVEMLAVLTVDADGRPNGVLGLTRDNAERQRAKEENAALHEQLRHSQKMETLGVLASGIAHDCNNLLTAILGTASAIKRRGRIGAETVENVERIENAARTASRLNKRLLGFARTEKSRRERVEMGVVVEDVIALLEHAIDKRIRIQTFRSAKRAVVIGDRAQLGQVVLNLALNAADAMPNGGQLTFGIRLAEGVPAGRSGQREAGPRPHVVAEVIDSGVGVPEKVRGRIFEPFFTTKPLGKGTGVGLSVACEIVERHGGSIAMQSQPGHGTTFRVWLPAARVTDRPRADVEEVSYEHDDHGPGAVARRRTQ